jgi:3-hydroxy-9,10-secoandrosta-1,3,5(10)-triene-9,17-dione monooxygenase
MLTLERQTTAAAPSGPELIRRAREIAPRLRARQAEADRLRDVPAESMAELSDAGLLRLFQPTKWGGYECDPRVLYAVQSVIAEGCPSTAWVLGVLSVESLLLGRHDDLIQEEVWGSDGKALISSAFAPGGTAEPVDGGYRLSGRWTFSSGSSFAQWAMVGARVADASPSAGMNLFMIPRSDYAIEDTWNTFGLRATGSNDLVGTDMFVPAHRRLTMDFGIQNVLHAALPTSPLYRLPWQYVFTGTVVNFAIGAAREGLRAFIEMAQTRVSMFTGVALKDDPVAAKAAARLHAEIETAEAMIERHIARQLDYVTRDEVISMPEALRIRTQQSSQVRKLAALVDDLMLLQGSKATALSSRLTQMWLDLMAARTHIGNDPTAMSTNYGGLLMAGAEL